MSVQIVVPELGESVLEATVKQWLKHEGDPVAVGEPLVELETDKVNVEVGAVRAGVLGRIERQEGEDVKVGDTLGVIEEVPAEEAARMGQPEEREKETTSGTAVQTGIAYPDRERQEAVEEQPEAPSQGDSRATPVAQRMARELNIDLDQVPGTGPGGRVTRENLEEYIQTMQAGRLPEPGDRDRQPEAPHAGPAIPQLEAARAEPARNGREERVKMSRRRRTIAQRLVEAQQTAAMLTTFNEIDMTAVMDLRKRRNEAFQASHGIKLGITSFFVKAVVGALKAFPRLNAEIQGDEMIIKHYYDIGIAVGASEGLVVPVLRDADRMSFAQIEQIIKDFAVRAEEGTLSLEDLRGGTFSITNGGVFGSLLSTPILNPPQVGILGLHKIEQRPVAVDGEVIIRPMMYVALSYDHRIVDGREAVQFLVRLKELVEEPERLLIEG